MTSTTNLIYPQITPYVYKITNKETGEFYIGSRYQNIKLNLMPEEDLGVVYFTSGKLEKQFKQNSNLFETQIIYRYDDYDTCYWYEQLIIKENIKNEKCMNKNLVDPDTNNKVFHMTGIPKTQEHKNKIGTAQIGKFISEETRKKIGIKSSLRKDTPERKKQKSEFMFENNPMSNPIHRESIKKALTGVPKSAEHIESTAMVRILRRIKNATINSTAELSVICKELRKTKTVYQVAEYLNLDHLTIRKYTNELEKIDHFNYL